MQNFNQDTVNRIVKENIVSIRGSSGSMVMPNEIVDIMTKSIYQAIEKYHESLTKKR